VRLRKHAGVHAAFGEQFARTGALDARLHRWLLDAYDQRIVADYGVEAALAAVDVETMLAHGREFLHEGRALLERPPRQQS
jgi:uncharacterized protein (UPF0332 family)